ncbi:MAG: rane protein of unknown function [Candidatus Saccharibacteria bacterium]|nr:rane protein of unknown function [Candidatus Saccharibacteria bacterium]
MNKLRLLLTSCLVLISSLVVINALGTTPASALFDRAKDDACAGIQATSGGTCNTSGANTTVNHALSTVINILSMVVGVAAVITIILSGLRYVTSQGDPNTVSTAQRSAIYALVGLVIVSAAQVLVRFVLKKVK